MTTSTKKNTSFSSAEHRSATQSARVYAETGERRQAWEINENYRNIGKGKKI